MTDLVVGTQRVDPEDPNTILYESECPLELVDGYNQFYVCVFGLDKKLIALQDWKFSVDMVNKRYIPNNKKDYIYKYLGLLANYEIIRLHINNSCTIIKYRRKGINETITYNIIRTAIEHNEGSEHPEINIITSQTVVDASRNRSKKLGFECTDGGWNYLLGLDKATCVLGLKDETVTRSKFNTYLKNKIYGGSKRKRTPKKKVIKRKKLKSLKIKSRKRKTRCKTKRKVKKRVKKIHKKLK